MARLLLVPALSLLLLTSAGSAQPPLEDGSAEMAASEAKDDKRFSGSIGLNQDRFFGFYPTLAAAYGITDEVDFTFYSILWTIPGFGVGGIGQDLWTEVGAGVAVSFLDGQISINPQVGVLSGTLLSGSDRALAAEGVVPNLTANYDGDHVEAEIYFGYYLALRGDRARDFIHYWANAGVKPLAFTDASAPNLISIGLHWEQLRRSRDIAAGAADLYKWLGPYVQFALPNGVSLRFAAGWDLEETGAPDFYKATVGFEF